MYPIIETTKINKEKLEMKTILGKNSRNKQKLKTFLFFCKGHLLNKWNGNSTNISAVKCIWKQSTLKQNVRVYISLTSESVPKARIEIEITVHSWVDWVSEDHSRAEVFENTKKSDEDLKRLAFNLL